MSPPETPQANTEVIEVVSTTYNAVETMYTNRDGEVDTDIVDKVMAIINRDSIGFAMRFAVQDERIINRVTSGVVSHFDLRALEQGMLAPVEELGAYPFVPQPPTITEASTDTHEGHGLPPAIKDPAIRQI